MDIREAHSLFLQYLAANETESRETNRNHRSTMQRYLSYAPGTRTTADLTRVAVEQFLIWGRLERHWAPSTHHSHLKHLSKFCEWAAERGLTSSNPCVGMKRPPLGEPARSRLTRDQALWALDVAGRLRCDGARTSHRNQAIIATFIFAGLRKSELLNLEVGDVDLDTNTIAVRAGKGNKDRLVPMAPRLKLYLEAYLKERRASGARSSRFFVGSRVDRGLSEVTVKRLFERLRRHLDIRVYPHMLRHTFATLMLEGGCDIYSLSRMMGHRRISTTTIYLDATVEHLRGAITKHPLNFEVLDARAAAHESGSRVRTGRSSDSVPATPRSPRELDAYRSSWC